MKKISAILLISLITLHFAGYYFIFYHAEKHLENGWQSRFIENDYDNLDLQQMSLNISFPYLTDQEDFVIVDEEMEIDGNVYRIVKKRYHNNTLDIIYVNDHEKEGLQKSMDDWKDDLADKKTTSQSHNSVNFGFHYQYYSCQIHFQPFINNHKIKTFEAYSVLFDSIDLDIDSPPPKFS